MALELYFLLLISTLQKGTFPYLSYFGVLLDEARVLNDSFAQCSFVFARRSTNETAHILARRGLHSLGRVLWEPHILD